MEPFTKHTGIVAALDRVNVDTDQIVPAQHLKRIERTGFGQFLFEAWRSLPDGRPDPDFELNHPGYQGASLLVSGRNFGSGSSREHAVWALQDAGYRAVIAPSFAEIFHRNCFESGLVPVLLPESVVGDIMVKAKEEPGYELTVDLVACVVSDGQGFSVPFRTHNEDATHQFRRDLLLRGLDSIGLTLEHEADIAAYEAKRAARAGG